MILLFILDLIDSPMIQSLDNKKTWTIHCVSIFLVSPNTIRSNTSKSPRYERRHQLCTS